MDEFTEITYKFPTPKLTNKETAEKIQLGKNVHNLSQTYNLPEFLITEILEHELPDDIYLTIKLLYENNLLNQYLKEFDNK
ncbi:MAG: hypothetical protein ACLS3L_00710 [Eubacterium sp.]|uniref:hypothetical protein n=1 Tax=Eubacterium sp. TaxID=142586 RepID=UPI0028050DBA|nr:hypothetical protein [uncultured Eubacterium sp.]